MPHKSFREFYSIDTDFDVFSIDVNSIGVYPEAKGTHNTFEMHIVLSFLLLAFIFYFET